MGEEEKVEREEEEKQFEGGRKRKTVNNVSYIILRKN